MFYQYQLFYFNVFFCHKLWLFLLLHLFSGAWPVLIDAFVEHVKPSIPCKSTVVWQHETSLLLPAAMPANQFLNSYFHAWISRQRKYDDALHGTRDVENTWKDFCEVVCGKASRTLCVRLLHSLYGFLQNMCIIESTSMPCFIQCLNFSCVKASCMMLRLERGVNHVYIQYWESCWCATI